PAPPEAPLDHPVHRRPGRGVLTNTSSGGRLDVFNAVNTCASGGPPPPPPGPDFSMSAAPASATVTAGNPASYTVTVTPGNGYAQDVGLSVPSALPAGATPSFRPNWATSGVGDPSWPAIT